MKKNKLIDNIRTMPEPYRERILNNMSGPYNNNFARLSVGISRNTRAWEDTREGRYWWCNCVHEVMGKYEFYNNILVK